MRETSINFVKGEDYVTYFSNDSTEIRYIKELLNNPEVTLVFDDTELEEGGIEVKLPKKYYRKPKPPRKMSEEQRQAASERFKNMWKDRKDE